ncbi:hypothetical protein N9Z12_00435 [Opitutaceae bacterium]|nr:hypothetical protein [Opitutaceae bacterium]
MRSNRLLGVQLVEENLIKVDDLEAANEKLLDLISTGTARQRTVLGILAYDLRVVSEETILLHQRDSDATGLVDLRHYELNEKLKEELDLEACWATWSIPFDVEEDLTFIATAYYLSPTFRKYWEEQYDGKVLWYGTTLEMIAEYLESQAGDDDPAAAAPPDETSSTANP